jgi:hypothetical protein
MDHFGKATLPHRCVSHGWKSRYERRGNGPRFERFRANRGDGPLTFSMAPVGNQDDGSEHDDTYRGGSRGVW